jgi:hypothetical protein
MQNTKKITIEYIPMLGSFLDENDIKWSYFHGKESTDYITIYYTTVEQLFMIAYQFGQFVIENK